MSMIIVYLLIAAVASCVGSVSGIGGGVIIKPVFDALGMLGVATVSFLSGCTVLSMSVASLLRSRKTNIKIEKNISAFLALGAAVGGVLGKQVFNSVSVILANETMLGLIQSSLLLLINASVFIFMLNKAKITMLKVRNPALSTGIGLLLGLVSVFLGIGGGPINVAVLFFFYSMPSKEAALNSLFIIMCSQITGLAQSIVTSTVPVFPHGVLAVMCFGGVVGAIFGSKISKLVSGRAVEKIFTSVLIFLILLNTLNVVQFSLKL